MNEIAEMTINEDLCIGCGNCVVTCPVNTKESDDAKYGKGPTEELTITMVINGKASIINPEKCTLCGMCVDACPTEAIFVPEKKKKKEA
ncbi:MAG: ferredoxin family protein [Candidatus Hydrothermarchaeota archaeon]